MQQHLKYSTKVAPMPLDNGQQAEAQQAQISHTAPKTSNTADASWLNYGTLQDSQATSWQTTTPKPTSKLDLQLLDKWILSKTENLTKKVTEAFEKCQFNIAVEEIRNFTWHVFCDYYIEAVKDRLYRQKSIVSQPKASSSTHPLRSPLPNFAAD